MSASWINEAAGRVAAVAVATVCFVAAVQLLRTVEKAYLLRAEIAADVAATGGTLGPDDETTRTAPVWAGFALALAAGGGVAGCLAVWPRPAAGAGGVAAPNQALQQTPGA